MHGREYMETRFYATFTKQLLRASSFIVGDTEELLCTPSFIVGGTEELLCAPSFIVGGTEGLLCASSFIVGGTEELLCASSFIVGGTEELLCAPSLIDGVTEELSRVHLGQEPSESIIKSHVARQYLIPGVCKRRQHRGGNSYWHASAFHAQWVPNGLLYTV